MAKRTNLRDFQRNLTARLEAIEHTPAVSSRLGFQLGGQNWLVDLTAVSEVVPSPAIMQLPLTRSWFRGLCNVRGILYGVADLRAFLGGPPTEIGPESRLLLIAPHVISNTGVLVSRMLGLRNPDQFSVRDPDESERPWVKRVYTDAQGGVWNELDVQGLVHHDAFLEVGIA